VKARLITLSLIILTVAMFRLLPHPPNVSPVAALALFGGAYFTDKRLAFLVPLLALFLSDLLIGLHDTMIFVYAGFVLTVVIGFWISKHRSGGRILAGVLGSTLLFFLITNFGAWLSHGMYPLTFEGLMQAYVAGIPFLHYSLIGDLLFSALLFGGYALLQRSYPSLAEA
jgi:hypothetical protein